MELANPTPQPTPKKSISQFKEDIEKEFDGLVSFAENILGLKLYPLQKAILNAYDKGELNISANAAQMEKKGLFEIIKKRDDFVSNDFVAKKARAEVEAKRDQDTFNAKEKIVHRERYNSLIKEDIKWVKKQPESLERTHILLILEQELKYGDVYNRSVAISKDYKNYILDKVAISEDYKNYILDK